jgi:hypothetical protein
MTTTLSTIGVELKAAPKELQRALGKAIAATAMTAERQAKLNLTTTLHARTGRLRNSVASSIKQTPTMTELLLQAGGGEGGQVRYARIHEEGGVIVPVRRKWLAIPLPVAKTAAGVSRYQTPRDVADLHFVPGKRPGTAYLAKPDGKPWFILKKRVDIPRRPYLLPALEVAADGLRVGLEKLTRDALALEGS